MTTRQINEYNANLLKWKIKHKEQEQRRIEALKRGEEAQYGYFKDRFKPEPEEQNKGDTKPKTEFIKHYKLELTYKQANEAIREGAQTINLILIIGRDYLLTDKNALLIPKFKFIKDINEALCLFTGTKFIKII